MGFIQISSVVPQMSNSLARITLAFSCQASLNSFESSSVSAHHSHPWHFCRALPSYFVDSPSVGFPSDVSGKESACQCRRHKGHSFDPWDGKIPWRRDGNSLQYSCLENTMDPGGLPSMGSQRLGHNWSDLTSTHSWVYWSLLTTKFRLHVLASIYHKSDAVSCSGHIKKHMMSICAATNFDYLFK